MYSVAKEARCCDTLVPAFRNDPRHRRGREAVSTDLIFPLRHARKEDSPLSYKQSLWKGEISSSVGGRKLPSPSPIMTEQKANHEHSLLNHIQPQQRHKETSAPSRCSVVWPQAAAAHIIGDPLLQPAGVYLTRWLHTSSCCRFTVLQKGHCYHLTP